MAASFIVELRRRLGSQAKCLVVCETPVDLAPLMRYRLPTEITVYWHNPAITAREDPYVGPDAHHLEPESPSPESLAGLEALRHFGVYRRSPLPGLIRINIHSREHLNRLTFDGVTADLLWLQSPKGKVLWDNYQVVLNENGFVLFDGVDDDDIGQVESRFAERTYPGYFESFPSPTLDCSVYRRIPISHDIRFAVVTMTYRRPNGTSKKSLETLVECLNRQSYRNFCFFMMGDDYEDQEEFEEIASRFDQKRTACLHLQNVKPAWERSRCKIRRNLWAVGGVGTLNTGIHLAKEQGFLHYVHVDDDDIWHPHHLLALATVYTMFPETGAAFTWGALGDWILPPTGPIRPNNFVPNGKDAFHSTFSYRFDRVPVEYQTLKDGEEEVDMPAADYEMLRAIGELVRSGKLVVTVTPLITCVRWSEGSSLKTEP